MFSARKADPLPLVRSSRRPLPRLRRWHLLLTLCVSLLLLSDALGGWTFVIPHAYAAAAASDASPSVTFGDFLKKGRIDQAATGFSFPRTAHTPPGIASGHDQPSTLSLASTVTMQPISQPLDSTLLVGSSSSGSPLDVVGSDKHLEVLIQPGSLDLSAATTSSGTPQGPFSLQIRQLRGPLRGTLAVYHLQVVDAAGHVVSGITLSTPISLLYHYQPSELKAGHLDVAHLVMAYPELLRAARKAHRSTAGLVLPLTADPSAQTLSTQSSTLEPSSLAVTSSATSSVSSSSSSSSGTPGSFLASEAGNSGQLSLRYPLSVAPNADGFVPELALQYSSQDTNARTDDTVPAGDEGDGWSLSLASISTGDNGLVLTMADHSSDELIATGQSGLYQTEHLSHLRIQQVTSSQTGQPCYQVTDRVGTFYEFGCTSDALQITMYGKIVVPYEWDLDREVAPHEGAGSAAAYIVYHYLQEGCDGIVNCVQGTIEHANIKQISYGTQNASGQSLTLAGTVDFFYRADFTQSPWATAYGRNYNCSSPPPTTTGDRCDDPPQPTGTIPVFSLQTISSYVGDDSSASHLAYQYQLAYQDSPFSCPVMIGGHIQYCAGEHLLSSITPVVAQNGSLHPLKAVLLGYQQAFDDYYDSVNDIPYSTSWSYLTSEQDSNSGTGERISYLEAHANSDGTGYITDSQGNIIDDRHDPFFCTLHNNQGCFGSDGFGSPDDETWSEQAVTQISSWSADSSGLSVSTSSYHYRLATFGTDNGQSDLCSSAGPQPGQSDCTYDSWDPVNPWSEDAPLPEFRGFAVVYTTTPAGDLVVDNYFATEGWNTPESDAVNYNSGNVYEEDVYRGNSTSGPLLSKTTSSYSGTNGQSASCLSNLDPDYPPCEVVLTSSRSTLYEGTSSSSAPFVETDNTYDDYSASSGLQTGYHNLTQAVITSANAPMLTKKWTYTTTDQTVNGTVYYTVDTPTHSELDDSSGHIWACENTTYDEGAASGVPTPAAGWPTTTSVSSNCNGLSGSITSYAGYDAVGNVVATVDGVATSNPGLYSSHGCTLSTTPVYLSSNWTAGRYTACTVYESTYTAQPASTTNALGQSASISYDDTQGAVPTSATDANGQTTSTSYSYDTSGNRTVSVKEPLENGSYTSQTSGNSSCTSSSTLPCFEIDTKSAQYPNAIKRIFYDSLGREVETRTTGPDAGHDTIVFTAYNDAAHTVFSSVPFEVNSGSGYVNPNGAVDYNGVAPGGTITYLDALGRPIASDDPMLGSSQEPGISCPGLSGTHTTCTVYGLGSANGDSATYAYSESIDPNNHVTVSFTDALGRTRYTQQYKGLGLSSLGSNIVQQKAIQYNALDEPTSVTVTDLAPQTGQTITSVTTSATYDDLGRVTSISDPDRGMHTYTYDNDDHVLTDVSGSRTLGANYDLLGRLGCVQDAVPTINATGACTSGSHPSLQYTYDTTVLVLCQSWIDG
jgi:YD repeat-containing protein